MDFSSWQGQPITPQNIETIVTLAVDAYLVAIDVDAQDLAREVARIRALYHWPAERTFT